MDRYRREAGWLGIAAIIVTFAGIGGGIALSPSFSVTANALSNLGAPGHSAGTATTALLFNGGLILGGLCGVGFGVVLASAADGLVERLGAILFVTSVALMAGVGVFPQTHPFHFPIAASFYLSFSVAAFVYGFGKLRTSDHRAGGVSIGLGMLNVAAWVVWVLTGDLIRAGLATPELVGAAAIAAWTIWTARSLGSTPPSGSGRPLDA